MIAVDKDKCLGCSLCKNVCPRKVITIANKKAIIADPVACLECGACDLNCPAKAISLTKGTGCLVAILKEDILKTVPKGTGCGCSSNSSCGC